MMVAYANGLMDVVVESAAAGVARVKIYLGHGDVLEVQAISNTDRYTRVKVSWEVPARVTGPPQSMRDRASVKLCDETLDQREEKVMP